ncbi:putative secreted protein (plasmid) [Bacillus thuringiensis serovar morrisoni str. 4AA1]|nr:MULTISPECIES: hypothetical protein [Bacillus]AJQ62747.1 hypothetical protein SD98_31375 [Bacillus thuringiensis serovar morrisoni]MED3102247.1 hypothetical protein [Bacillus thuringiensis]MRA99436.1 hypothetical protein [Bacillus thuringiensis]OTY44124.1 hypothetical protein BK736_05520 [Bacillus thuringiensis serovar poloniensis]RNG17970.1 hypothetical protein EEL55_30880 [Bacillus thuringiensis]
MQTLAIKTKKGQGFLNKGKDLLRKGKSWLLNESSDETTDKAVWMYIGVGVALVVLTIILLALKTGTTNIADLFVSVTKGSKTEPSGWGK